MSQSNILVISTSLHSGSRSRLLAKTATDELKKLLPSGESNSEEHIRYADLSDLPLPFCDGEGSYQDENVLKLGEMVDWADGFLIAGPIYNYDFGAAAKNMIELVGKRMSDKPVGFLCAAGGQGSLMAPMSFATSMMLDFRCLVLPKFVYATGTHFQGDEISDPEIKDRIGELCKRLVKLSGVLQ